MARDRDPPFFAGSILGLRAWTVHVGLPASTTRLGSAAADSVWEPGGEWTEAVCAPPGGGRRRHRAPRRGCTCGLYAFHPRPGVLASLFSQHVRGGTSLPPGAPGFVETVGVCGLVEACGRIEVHEDGFRAERARPVALIAGSKWHPGARAAVDELAALYAAEVIEAASPGSLFEYAKQRGGVLEPVQIGELLEGVEPELEEKAPSSAVARRPAPPAPPSPSGRDSAIEKAKRVAELAAMAVFMLVGGIFQLAIYGTIALVAVAMIGGPLFGWFGWDDPPPRPLARVAWVKVDRERCVIRAEVAARRKLGHLDLLVAGRLGNGEGMGHVSKTLGPLRRGRSRITVMRPGAGLCSSAHTFTVRVRPVGPGPVGNPAESQPSTPIRG